MASLSGGKLHVRLIAGHNLTGGSGDADPYVAVRLGDVEFRTPTMAGEASPKFGEGSEFTFHIADRAGSLNLEVRNAKAIFNSKLGSFTVSLEALAVAGEYDHWRKDKLDGGDGEIEYETRLELLESNGHADSAAVDPWQVVDADTEEELYRQRSRMYRFAEDKWCEKGIGDSRFLKCVETGRVRYVLQDEKSGSLVANHYVFDEEPFCDLRPNAGSDRTWAWSAKDCSEGEAKADQFALKLPSAELAQKFKEAFDDAKAANSKVTAFQGGAKEAATKTSQKAEAPSPSTAADSPIKTGGAPSVANISPSPENPFAGASLFGSPQSSGGLFGAPQTSFSFSSSPATAAATGGLFSSPPADGLFSGGSSSSTAGGLFGSSASSGGLFGGSASSSSLAGGLFGSSASSGGLFSNAASSSGGIFGSSAPPAAEAPAAEQNEDEYVVEEEVTVIPGWAPSVTLELKEVMETGVEDEEEIYSQRSKLYRFRTDEWKERGVGDAKLLKHKTTGRIRFFMRQEKTGKIVGNHYVISTPPYCDLQPNAGSEKCWVWSAQDCSDETMEVERLALKFGSAELAKAFKEEFDAAKARNTGLDNGDSAAPTASAPSSTGVAKTVAKPKEEEKKEEPKEEKPAETNSVATTGLFGSLAASTGGGLFGGGAPASSGGLFSGGIFGGSSGASSGGGLFGNSIASSGGLFGASPAPAQESNAPAPAAEGEDEYVPEEEVTVIPGWSASVTIDILDKVVTGEEEEQELYCQRSKLYRFRDGEWKERGLGDAKLLKHKATGKVRFFMRQEKTMKIVGNHYVIDVPPYCDLQPNAGSEKCWVWSAQDCAEGDVEVERLALKFGTPELAKAFQAAFDEAKVANAALGDLTSGEGGNAAKTASPKATAKASPKRSPVRAKAASPKATPPAGPADASNPFAGISFAGSGAAAPTDSSSGGLFSNFSLGEATGGLFSGAAAAAASSSGGLFGAPAASSGGLFGATGGGGLFSSPAATSTGGLFGSSPAAAAAPAASEEKTGEDDEYVQDEEVTVIPGWAPSVTIDVLSKVETGEEEEDEIYSQRSKLYRFRDGEWKERGLGDAKLLKHKETGKVRFFMRQEKTMKIVGNFYAIDVPPYCDLQPNAGSKKCWVWSAQDCSEGDVQVERLALKFGTEELAEGFRDAFEAAKAVNQHVLDLADNASGAGSAVTGTAEAPKPFVANISTPAREDEASVAGGEEEELFSHRSKLYVFKDTEWKEKGLGDSKILKHRSSGKVRYVLQQEKSSALAANHYIVALEPFCDLRANAGSDKCWVWTAQDCADGDKVTEQFALKFGTTETAQAFKEKFDEGKALNGEVAEFAAELAEEAQETNNTLELRQALTPGLQKAPLTPGLQKAAGSTGGGLFSGIFSGGSGGSSSSTSLGSTGGGLFSGGLFSSSSSGSTGGGLFGGSASSGGLFSGGLFSNSKDTASTGGGLFGGAAAASSGGGLFGGSGGGLFGGSAAANSGGGLFGSAAASSGGLFSSTPAAAPAPAVAAANGEEDNEYVEEEEVTVIPGWEASVTINVLDQVATGEEEEEELYSQRSKLFRFKDGEWKERGLGDSKLLKHKQTGKVRFMMRQEKTMKIVANHYVIDTTPYCDLQPNAGSEKCWVWSVPDCAEEEVEVTRFALKFGAVESAQAFKTAFDDAKEVNKKAGISGQGQATSSKPKAVAKKSPTVKPQAKSPPKSPSKSPEVANPFSGISFTGSASTGGGGLFSGLASTGGGLFGGSTGGGLFSNTAAAAAAAGAASATSSSPFGGGLAALNTTTPAASAEPPAAGQTVEGDNELVPEEEVTVIEGWTPSVTLDLKEVETGEEGEDVLYEQRSKLYRFRDGDWKERGLGEAKILRNKKTGKTRFLLRQEKTQKIVANHLVVEHASLCSVSLQKGSEKIMVWMAQDYSEEEPVMEQFALKFGTAELAQAFKVAYDKAKKPVNLSAKLAANEEKAKEGAQESDDDDDDEDYAEDEGWEEDQAWTDVGGASGKAPMSFAEMAAQQASGWRCPGCRLSWPETAVECGVCEIPRPGFEEAAAKKEEEQTAQKANAMAAFLGGGGGSSSSSATPAASGGFGGSSIFGGGGGGGGNSASSGGLLFGSGAAPAAAPLFGSGTGAPLLFGSAEPAAAPAASGGGLFGGGASTGAPMLFGSGATPSAASSSSAAPFFGSGASASSASSSSSSGGGLFGGGAPAATGSGLFGSSTTTSSGGLFGSAPAASTGGGGLFGSAPSPPSSGGGLFGATPSSSGGLFGSTPASSSSSTGLFGAPAAASSSSASSGGGLFGATPAATGSSSLGLFAKSSAPPPPPPPPAETLPATQAAGVGASSGSTAAPPAAAAVEDNSMQHVTAALASVLASSSGLRGDAANVASVHIGQDALKHDMDRVRIDGERLRAEVERLNKENSDYRKKQAETDAALQRLLTQQAEDRHVLDLMRQELQKEREARMVAIRQERDERMQERNREAGSGISVAAVQRATKVAEEAQQAIAQLRQEKNADLLDMNAAMDSVERTAKDRLNHLETQMNRCYMDTLKRMSLSERILYLQTQHSNRVGAPMLAGLGADAGTMALDFSAATPTKAEDIRQPTSRPLLRRV
eukprot:TRINITY_DN143_c0_g2_i1.p1 TRINITY_DN143_c0_g2~~TRINITY_DN143_c0_g2_i1.p1  ORF type:complete len:2603 (-),score=942.64 TRINITY_DN143_c0_g2_i1:139-7947(-)